MAYTGPDLAALKDMVNAIVRRQLAADVSLNATLLELSLNAALRTIQDSYDGWRVLEQTVTAADDGTPLRTTPLSREVAIPALYKDSARLYYLDGSTRKPIPCAVDGKPLTMEWVWENYPNPTQVSDTPEGVVIRGESFLFVPTPASALDLSLEARCYVPDLDDVHIRNWFTMHLTMPLVQLAVGHALSLLHEEEWASYYFTLGRQGITEKVGAELTELARRAPVVVGQEPM